MQDLRLKDVWLRLEEAIESVNRERERDGLPSLECMEVLLLGQLSLFFDEAARANLNLWLTQDVDAIVKGGWTSRIIFKSVFEQVGLKYDDLSTEIWIPDDTQYKVLHNSYLLHVSTPEPIYILVSKAVKAKEKNRELIIRALAYYGDELAALLTKYNADMKFFLGT